MPQIGERRSDGKVWAGDDFGWQSPATIWKRQPPGKVGDTRTLPGLGTKVYTGTDYGWQLQSTIDKKKQQQPKPDPKPATPDPKPTLTPTPTPTPTPRPTPTPTPTPRPKPLTADQKSNLEYQKLREKDPEAAKKLGMEIWAKKYAKTLAPEVVRRQERATELGRGDTQSGYPVIKKYVKPSVEKSAPTPTATPQPTPPAGNGKPMETGPELGVGNDPEPRPKPQPARRVKLNSAYEVVLDYLLSEGHADTVEEAHYVMMQLDSEFIQNIIEN